MAIAFGQPLFQGSSKTTGLSLVISGTKTIAVGQTIVVGFGSDPAAGTYSVADNLGNTYTLVHSSVSGSGTAGAAARLWRSDVTNGGTLTSITVAHPSLAARAAIAVSFTGVGTVRGVGNDTFTSGNSNVSQMYPTGEGLTSPGPSSYYATPVLGDLWIGVAAQEGVSSGFAGTVSDEALANPLAAIEPTVEQQTVGGGGATNISMGMAYWIASDTASRRLLGNFSGVASINHPGVGAAIAESVVAPPTARAAKPLIKRQAVNRAAVM